MMEFLKLVIRFLEFDEMCYLGTSQISNDFVSRSFAINTLTLLFAVSKGSFVSVNLSRSGQGTICYGNP